MDENILYGNLNSKYNPTLGKQGKTLGAKEVWLFPSQPIQFDPKLSFNSAIWANRQKI